MGHFSCRAGPMSTVFLAGRAGPRPTKCQQRERGWGGGAATAGGDGGRPAGVLAAHPKALGARSAATDSELEDAAPAGDLAAGGGMER